MTCIVGIIERENDRIIIGGDSAGVGGYDVTIRKDPKVFRIGDFVFGCTSSFRMIQLLRYSFEPPDVAAPLVGFSQGPETEDIFKYMCTAFVNRLRRCLSEGGYRKRKDEVEEGGQFLVGYKGRLFSLPSHRNWEKAVGSFQKTCHKAGV